MQIKLLSSDPGVKNYAYSIVTVKKQGTSFKVTVHENGMIPQTVQAINVPSVLVKELKAYLTVIKRLVKKHKPNVLSAERYMTRGIKGPTVEYYV